jgi:hypothetical protein
LKKANGLIVYEGPSLIDQKPIVAIITGLEKSMNRKTGNMLQTWIVRQDMSPVDILKQGQDSSICGQCKHSNSKMKSCYVNVGQAPYAVWHAYKRGVYAKDDISIIKNRKIRLGAYGDPAAIPFDIWDKICITAGKWTAYTHQWQESWVDQRLKRVCMASVDTPDELARALRMKWTPFYARPKGSPVPTGAFVCPASEEANKRLQCHECMACMGKVHNGIRAFPTIEIHGPAWKVNKYSDKVQKYTDVTNFAELTIGGVNVYN